MISEAAIIVHRMDTALKQFNKSVNKPIISDRTWSGRW